MSFSGRWVPMEVMNTIFLLWAIAVVMVGAALYWFTRSGRSNKVQQNSPPASGWGKRNKRKKR